MRQLHKNIPGGCHLKYVKELVEVQEFIKLDLYGDIAVLIMPKSRLIQVKLKKYIDRILPVHLHWLDMDQEWMENNYGAILDELCRVIERNLDEFDKRSRTESKLVYKRVEDSEILSLAVSLQVRDSCHHCVIQIKGENNRNYIPNYDYALVAWIGPRVKDKNVEWPVECIC